MGDSIAIVPELTFSAQILELTAHFSRSVPETSTSRSEFVAEFQELLGPASATEEQEEISDDKKQEVVRKLVAKVGELKGGLSGGKEGEAESAYLLLLILLASTFDVEKPEYAELVEKVLAAVQAGAAQGRSEVAYRVLNNTYNILPSSSPQRPKTLLALLRLLSTSSDLATLTLSSHQIQSALTQWSISTSEKLTFLQSAADLYPPTAFALELRLLALREADKVDEKLVEQAVVCALSVPSRYDVSEVVKAVKAIGATFNGPVKELVGLFSEVDELEAVTKVQSWASANKSWVQSFSVKSFTGESIVRKIKLNALAALCARSTTKIVKYQEIAKALDINVDQVEAWVIDAIHAKLITGRLSQPLLQLRIQSATSRRFGKDEWTLLAKRLGEWRETVEGARKVVEEAETLGAQPAQQQQGQQQRRREVEA